MGNAPLNDLKIFIFTHPPFRLKNTGYFLKILIKIILSLLVWNPNKVVGLYVGGHTAVTLSLISGLKKLNIQFSLNNYRDLFKADLVLVLSGVTVLEEILQEKKRGLVAKLWAGPNISVLPNENNFILCDKSIDTVLVPSQWIKDKYCKICEELKENIFIWPAGTNLDLYPMERIKANRSSILVYHKYQELNQLTSRILDQINITCSNRGILVDNIYYGSYKANDYVCKLSRSFLCFYLSDRPESQGLALQESWAMNVPTAVLRQELFSYCGFTSPAFSSPYLSNRTGIVFDNSTDVDSIINYFISSKTVNSSRAWIEDFLTDAISANILIDFYYEN